MLTSQTLPLVKCAPVRSGGSSRPHWWEPPPQKKRFSQQLGWVHAWNTIRQLQDPKIQLSKAPEIRKQSRKEPNKQDQNKKLWTLDWEGDRRNKTKTEELGVRRRATIPGSGQRERAWHWSWKDRAQSPSRNCQHPPREHCGPCSLRRTCTGWNAARDLWSRRRRGSRDRRPPHSHRMLPQASERGIPTTRFLPAAAASDHHHPTTCCSCCASWFSSVQPRSRTRPPWLAHWIGNPAWIASRNSPSSPRIAACPGTWGNPRETADAEARRTVWGCASANGRRSCASTTTQCRRISPKSGTGLPSAPSTQRWPSPTARHPPRWPRSRTSSSSPAQEQLQPPQARCCSRIWDR